jgi:hypothetical protein
MSRPAFLKSVSMRQDSSANPTPPVIEQRAGESRLLSRLYREVGMAVVAAELDLQLETLEPDIAESIRRGASALASPRRGTLAA